MPGDSLGNFPSACFGFVMIMMVSENAGILYIVGRNIFIWIFTFYFAKYIWIDKKTQG